MGVRCPIGFFWNGGGKGVLAQGVADTEDDAEEIEDVNDEFHLALHEIELENIDIHKLNEENNIIFDALVYQADAKFTRTKLKQSDKVQTRSVMEKRQHCR